MRVEYEKEEKIGKIAITFLTINSLQKLLIVTALSNSIFFFLFVQEKKKRISQIRDLKTANPTYILNLGQTFVLTCSSLDHMKGLS